MVVVETKEVNNERRYIKLYKFDNTVQINSLIDFIKQFENEQTKMLVCKCHTYDSSSHPVYYDCRLIEEIKMVYDKADSPVFDFTIDFGDRENEQYLFSLVTSINSNSLIYEVDKKKLNNISIKRSGKNK